VEMELLLVLHKKHRYIPCTISYVSFTDAWRNTVQDLRTLSLSIEVKAITDLYPINEW
jgi:hypothetical protein